MKIELVIPVYNEETKLCRSIGELKCFFAQSHEITCQITMADNGSSDRTLDIARKLSQKEHALSIIHFPQKGRGGALRSVWLAYGAPVENRRYGRLENLRYDHALRTESLWNLTLSK